MVHFGYCCAIVAAALVSTGYAGGGATIARTSPPNTHAIVARLLNSTVGISRDEVLSTAQTNSKRTVPPRTWNDRIEKGKKRISALETKLHTCFKPPNDPSTLSTCHDETLKELPTKEGYEIRGADKEAMTLSQLWALEKITWTATDELLSMGIPETTLFKEMTFYKVDTETKYERLMMKMFISVDDSMEKRGAVVREEAWWQARDRENEVFASDVMMKMIRMVRGQGSLDNIEIFLLGTIGNVETISLLDYCEEQLVELVDNRKDLHGRPGTQTLDMDKLYTETEETGTAGMTATRMEVDCLKALSGSANAYGYFRLLTDFPKQFGLKKVRFLHLSNTIVFRLERYASFRNRKVSTG